MLQPLASAPKRALEFGIYRDGDNNLDASQEAAITQALSTSRADHSIEFTVEDTTHRRAQGDNFGDDDNLETRAFTVSDGVERNEHDGAAVDMASPKNLAQFVAQTLDHAEASGATQTWIDLCDHGAGDGGGLEADSTHHIMAIDGMAAAIAEGVKLHAQAHPEDAGRRVDGVVANQCLMSSLGFADGLSHAGVTYLAASPETMLSPGTPSEVAHDIAANINDPKTMAKHVVDTVMDYRYRDPAVHATYGPAACFDVLDLDSKKWSTVEGSVKALNDALARLKPAAIRDVREDARAVSGMVRFPDATPDMPWLSDRPAIALYKIIASDARLDATVRGLAHTAATSIDATVLAHRESDDFAPFGGSDYSDAAGPTVHFPVTDGQFDPWAPQVSETDNAFYKAVDGVASARHTVA